MLDMFKKNPFDGVCPNIEQIWFGSKPKKTKQRRVTKTHTKHFHKNKSKIGSIILGTLDDGEVIYGEQALKARFPKFLERPTTDYDILSKHPKREAIEAEKALDKAFGGDYFYVKEAQHPGTYKVVAHANQEGYADFTEMPEDKKIKYDTIKKRNYVKLSYEEKNRQKSLKDPNSAWRHGKDRDALNRIRLYKQMKGDK